MPRRRRGDPGIPANRAHRLRENFTLSEALPIRTVAVAIRKLGTFAALTANVREEAPAGTTTEAGTLSRLLVDETAIAAPPAGAAPVSVTVQLLVALERSAVGLQANEARPAARTVDGITVRAALCDVPAAEAEIVTPVEAVTGDVLMVKTPVLAPEGTVMLAGTAAALGLELASVTTVPDDGAGTLRVTMFDVVAAPPVTVFALRLRPAAAMAQYNGAPAPPNS